MDILTCEHLKKTYHGGGGEQFFEKHTRLVRHYLTRTDQNIVLSGFLAKVFERFQLPYTVIPNIIELDPALFRQRETLKPNFICTRAHEPLYNIPCILHAFKEVQAKLPEASLTLVGEGSDHQRLVALVNEMGLRNVAFTGKVDNSEIYKQLDNTWRMFHSECRDFYQLKDVLTATFQYARQKGYKSRGQELYASQVFLKASSAALTFFSPPFPKLSRSAAATASIVTRPVFAMAPSIALLGMFSLIFLSYVG